MEGFDVIVLALAVFIALCGPVGMWNNRRRAAESELLAPLLPNDASSSADARVESAIRAARLGFRTCSKCLFDNLHASAFCAICGVAFASEKKKKSRKQRANKDAPSSAATTATTQGLSARQLRVRQRKRWMRGVAEDGKVYWQCTDTDGSNSSVGLEAFVLRLEAPHCEPVQEEEPRTNESESLDVAVPTAEIDTDDVAAHVAVEITDEIGDPNEERVVNRDENKPTLASLAKSLDASVSQLVVELESAKDANAAVPSIVLTRDDPTTAATIIGHATEEATADLQHEQEVRDTVLQAQLDFPTKLAQFITATSSLFFNATTQDDGTTHSTRFQIRRGQLLQDSVNAIATMTPRQAHAAIRVSFENEQGIDAGGVYREWFLLLNEAIVTPEAGVFVCVDQHDQTFYLNPHSRELLGENHLAHFLAAGRLLGRALLDGNVTGFHLSLPLLKIILGLPVGFDDLQYFDPEIHKNLTWLLEHDGVDALCLDFTVIEKLPSGKIRTVELVMGGSDIDVTDENKMEFVDRKLKYLLFESVSSQIFAFLKGVYQVIPAELLMLFDAEELDLVLSGSDEIDVDDWERHTKYTPDLVDHQVRRYFWELVREMTTQERRLLLQFVTGSSRVPPAGFVALSSYDGRLSPFTMYGVDLWQDGGYVRSHACFNRLDLPRHRTKKNLQRALSAALLSDDRGFTIE